MLILLQEQEDWRGTGTPSAICAAGRRATGERASGKVGRISGWVV